MKEDDEKKELDEAKKCPICNSPMKNYLKYQNIVCRNCDKRAVNIKGVPPSWNSQFDEGDNPVFIDGKKCWRDYNFGGYITLLDTENCKTIKEFLSKGLVWREKIN